MHVQKCAEMANACVAYSAAADADTKQQCQNDVDMHLKRCGGLALPPTRQQHLKDVVKKHIGQVRDASDIAALGENLSVEDIRTTLALRAFITTDFHTNVGDGDAVRGGDGVADLHHAFEDVAMGDEANSK